ncbi:hypothetical protein [Hydrogenophaga sp.]|uniref:hypothetical protein n=1 Tax=Hydrogenophaga sp. TaxID=1904254 RepID=UPI002717F801|nr:hypothetical protein [Hydrogenophaga sp.]MDO8904181.1 hypothetical protein [Hydrogenophaga sp.]
MNRCLAALSTPSSLARMLAAALALSAAPWSGAQTQPVRNFPDSALRAKMVVVQPPEIKLNGEPARLSPGSRIRGQNNTIILSGTLVGQEVLVNYVRDSLGLVHDVWVLNPAEAAEKRAGAATERNFRFSSETPANPDAPTRAN